MYIPNQIVDVDGMVGRVIYHDPMTQHVHVMFRLNNNTWKIQKCDVFFCKPAQVFLWTIHSAFSSRYPKQMRTPQFRSVERRTISEDYTMEV
jgi:hypothetical protein